MKVAASDYDGTLFREDRIAKSDAEAIKKWREAGHKFGVVSGRDHGMLVPQLQHYGVGYDYLACNNGGIICTADGEVLWEAKIAPEMLAELTQLPHVRKSFHFALSAADRTYLCHASEGTWVIREAKRRKNCVLIHVLTQKGKGYAPAEKHPARFHGAEPFDVATGVPVKKKTKANYTDIFSTVMVKLAARHPDVVAITAAMPDGTGLKRFRKAYPERFFDVGIAEEHAVTFAAGLAVGGLHPVVAIYSSFLQRAYDQILHDVCLQNVPVIFAIDRAGLVGSDGETHQGIFDLSFLSSIPNMHIMAPKNKWELSDMMKFAYDFKGPIAIRYPRGEAYDGLADKRADVEMGKSEMLFEEEKIALFAVGSMVKTAVEVREALKEKGISCTVVNARFVKPIDENMVRYLAKNHDLIVPMEENVASGGLSEKVITLVEQEKLPIEVLPITIPDEYVEHGNVDILKQEIGISTSAVLEKIEKELEAK